MNEHFVQRSSCPACGSQNCGELLRTSYTAPPISDYLVAFYSVQGGVDFELLAGSDYVLAECRGCGLVFQSEIPGPELSHKLYEEWIDPHKAFEVYEAPRALSYHLALVDEIANLVAHLDMVPSGLKVLDFGMGWGFWCRAASGLGCETYGIDVAPSRIENAVRRGIHVVRWEEMPDRAFDLVNADQVFEHIPHPLVTLRRLRSALKPGGLLKVSVPDGRNVRRNLPLHDWTAPAGSPHSLNPVAPLEHINCFTRGTLIRMAARAGLRPVFVPRRYLVGSSRGVSNRLFVRKAVKTLLGAWARPLVPVGTTIVFELAS